MSEDRIRTVLTRLEEFGKSYNVQLSKLLQLGANAQDTEGRKEFWAKYKELENLIRDFARDNLVEGNEVKIAGRLTREPTLQKFSDGTPYCNFTLRHAVPVGTDENGEKKWKVDYFNAQIVGQAAEAFVNQKLGEGDRVSIVGRLQTYKNQDQQIVLAIRANRFMVLSRAQNREQANENTQDTAPSNETSPFMSPGDEVSF